MRKITGWTLVYEDTFLANEKKPFIRKGGAKHVESPCIWLDKQKANDSAAKLNALFLKNHTVYGDINLFKVLVKEIEIIIK